MVGFVTALMLTGICVVFALWNPLGALLPSIVFFAGGFRNMETTPLERLDRNSELGHWARARRTQIVFAKAGDGKRDCFVEAVRIDVDAVRIRHLFAESVLPATKFLLIDVRA